MNKRKPLIFGAIFFSPLIFLFVSCTNQTKQPTSLLLFNQQTEEASKIYSMYPDGSHITHVTDLPTYSQYWLSPDGTKLAFIAGTKLSIIDILTGEIIAEIKDVGITISEHFVDDVVWSPKGDKLVYVSDSIEKLGTSIWLYDLSTRAKSPLTNDEALDLEPAWSADGQNVAFVTHRVCEESIWDCPPEQEYWDIATINIDTFDRKTITDFKNSGLFPQGNKEYALLCNLLWSPNNEYIAFENACSQPGLQWWKQVFVVPTNGSNLFQLTHFSEYDPDATQFPISIFLYSTQWMPSSNTLLMSYTEAELIEEGKRNNRFLLVSENEFPNPDNQSESNTLGKSAYWSPNKEYVLGNATSILGFSLERPFIGQLNTNEIITLDSPELLPYGSCHSNIAHWSPDSQYVSYATNEQDNICSHTPMQNQDIVVITVSGTNVISNLVDLSGNNRLVGWLSLP